MRSAGSRSSNSLASTLYSSIEVTKLLNLFGLNSEVNSEVNGEAVARLANNNTKNTLCNVVTMTETTFEYETFFYYGERMRSR